MVTQICCYKCIIPVYVVDKKIYILKMIRRILSCFLLHFFFYLFIYLFILSILFFLLFVFFMPFIFLVFRSCFTRLWFFLSDLLLGLFSKSTHKLSHSSKYSAWAEFHLILLDGMFLKWWSFQQLIKFLICCWKAFYVLNMTLWDQVLRFLFKMLTFNRLVSFLWP